MPTRVALLRHTDANKLPVTQLILEWFLHKCWHKVSDNAKFGTEFVVESFSQSDAPSSVSVRTVTLPTSSLF